MLSPGTYIYNHKRVAQDIDLKFYQNGERIARSTSAFDPFEMVEFTTTSNANLEIVIERYRNSGVGDVKLGYIMSEQDDE